MEIPKAITALKKQRLGGHSSIAHTENRDADVAGTTERVARWPDAQSRAEIPEPPTGVRTLNAVPLLIGRGGFQNTGHLSLLP